MTVRKNFVFNETVAAHLEALAKKQNKSQTTLIAEMIELQYREISKEEKLKAFENFKGSCNGCFEDLSIQEIKANMDV